MTKTKKLVKNRQTSEKQKTERSEKKSQKVTN